VDTAIAEKVNDRSASELDIAAAKLAWVMLRFVQAALPPAVKEIPELGGRLGDVAVKFFPSETVVPLAHASATLLEFPKPVALTAMSARGLVGVWFPAHLADEDRMALERMKHAAHEGLARFCRELGLTAESRLLLAAGDEVHVFPLKVLARCVRDYLVFVGWVLQPFKSDPRADARLHLVRADGSSYR
jgi:hypothetical protein